MTCRSPRRGPAARTCGWSTGARWRSRSSAPPPSSRSTAARVSAARIAITALAPTIHRVEAAEQALVGTDGGRSAAEAAAAAAAAAAAPISDVRGSADYRRAMAAVITRRAIEAAVARARGEDVAIPASNSTYASI